MTLTKTNIKTRLDAAVADPGIPLDVKALIQDLQRNKEEIGLSLAQKANLVDTFLDTDPATWDVGSVATIAQLILRNWDQIPSS